MLLTLVVSIAVTTFGESHGPALGELVRRRGGDGLAFQPIAPLAAGGLARRGGPLDPIAGQHQASSAQIALAWLLQRSPVILPIPGTSSVHHLEENVAAASIRLTQDEFEQLSESRCQ